MGTLELLLAFHLRDLAGDLRSASRANFYTGIFSACDEYERRRRLETWDRENPIGRFIPAALEEVELAADHIRDLMRGLG